MKFLLMIQVQHADNLAVLLITMMEIIYAFGVLVVCCEICQRATQSFDECSDMVAQFDWHLFPVRIQRMMPTILHFTQQPIEIVCFGSTACNREIFKYVSVSKTKELTVIIIDLMQK